MYYFANEGDIPFDERSLITRGNIDDHSENTKYIFFGREGDDSLSENIVDEIASLTTKSSFTASFCSIDTNSLDSEILSASVITKIKPIRPFEPEDDAYVSFQPGSNTSFPSQGRLRRPYMFQEDETDSYCISMDKPSASDLLSVEDTKEEFSIADSPNDYQSADSKEVQYEYDPGFKETKSDKTFNHFICGTAGLEITKMLVREVFNFTNFFVSQVNPNPNNDGSTVDSNPRNNL
jgi:hypothetical protein